MVQFARLLLPLASAAALLLGGCHRKDDLAQLDNELIANAADPAVSSALQDQIMVDPTLSQQSNRNAVRPPERPVQAQYPPGASTGTQPGPAGCGASFRYDKRYASQLPQPFTVYPGARLTEAAASDRDGCHMRMVSFRAPAAPEQLLSWYADLAGSAGYSAERETRGTDSLLGGTRGESAFVLIVSPSGSGADVSLIANVAM